MSLKRRLRQFVAQGVTASSNRREAAGRRLLDAPDMEVPDVAELKSELDALRARRA
ncbi:MAG TPA: hypothetical protein VNM89_01915 [Solirubrobacterales bacterium]|nr:hypothetical protein [Solirubrobacterales bacterium]